jgi:hypothetical protein
MEPNPHPQDLGAPAALVTRDAHLIDDIDTRMAAHATCRVLTPYVGRLLRREYNWLARKMYLRGRSDDRWRKQALRLIDEIAAEITMFELDVEHLNRWPDRSLSGGEVTVRVVDITSARLLAQWRRLDSGAAILYRAQIYGMEITTAERWERLGPITRANSRLINHCLGTVDAERVADSAAALRLSD